MKDKTKVIRVFETFAGIGAQHKAISNIDKTNKKFRVIGTSEWDVRAMIAYSNIHNKDKFISNIKKVESWDDKKVDQFLMQRTFSLNSKKPSSITRKKREFKNVVVASNITNNNYPDINKITGENIEGVDLLTYSFPCQGLSIANMGRAKGIKLDTDSTSNLIWQIKRLLDDTKQKKIKLPKYLLMENVKTLIGKNHKEDYEAWKEYLSSIGYITYTFVLNGLEHGALQKRERVFGLSIKKEFKLSMDENDIKELLINKYGKKLDITQRKEKYINILSLSTKEEHALATPNNTPSRIKMAKKNIDLITDAKKKKYIFNTLTTKQDRHPNIGMINTVKKKGKLSKRFITPREGYMIMGFDNEDYSNVEEFYAKGILTKESLYRQGGNSIVVNVLEDIFKFINDIERGVYE